MSDSSEEDTGEVTTPSDVFDRGHHLIPPVYPIHQKIERLSTTLRDTSRNLKSIDKMVGTYREVGLRQTAAIEKLHEGLTKNPHFRMSDHHLSQGNLSYNMPGIGRSSSPNRLFHVSSDDYFIVPRENALLQPHNRSVSGSGMRFHSPPPPLPPQHRMSTATDINTPIAPLQDYSNHHHYHSGSTAVHELHQSVRDLVSEQQELKSELQRLTLQKDREQFVNVRLKDGAVENVGVGNSRERYGSGTLFSKAKPEYLRTIASQVDKRLFESKEALRANRIEREEKHHSELLHGDTPTANATNATNHSQSDGSFVNDSSTEPPFLSSTLKSALKQLHEKDKNVELSILKRGIVPGSSKPTSIDEPIVHTSSDVILKSKLNQSEIMLKSAETEIAELKRKLLQEETQRITFHRQFDELQNHWSISEKENSRLKALVDNMESKIKHLKSRLDESESVNKSNISLEQELRELRMKLKTTVTIQEFDEVQKNREKTERLMDQTKEKHLQLIQEMTEKDKQIQRLLQEIRSLQEQNETIQRTKDDFQLRLSTTERNLSDIRLTERLALERAERAEKTVEEMLITRERLQQTSNESMYNLQNKQESQEAEKLRLHESLSTQTRLTETICRERDQIKQKYNDLLIQSEELRRELENILNVRSKQEELLHRRNEEMEILQRKSEELTSKVNVMDKAALMVKYTQDATEKELSLTREDRARLEERLSALESMEIQTKETCRLLKIELENSINEKIDWQEKFQTAQLTNKDLRHEIDNLRKSLKESQWKQRKLSEQSEELQSQSSQNETQWNQERNVIRQHVQKTEGCVKILRARCNRQCNELNRLHEEHWRHEQELVQKSNKIVELRQMLQKKEVDSESELLKGRQRAELACADLQEKLDETLQQQNKILNWTTQDVDGLVELVAKCIFTWGENNQQTSSTTQSAQHQQQAPTTTAASAAMDLDFSSMKLNPNSSVFHSSIGSSNFDINRWLIDLKSKLSWLKTEIQRLLTESNQKSQEDNCKPKTEAEKEHAIDENEKTITITKSQPDLEERSQALENFLCQDMEMVYPHHLEQLASAENKQILQRYDSLKETLNTLRKELQSVSTLDLQQQNKRLNSSKKSVKYQ